MTRGEVACDCKVVFGDERDDLASDEVKERGVDSGDVKSDFGLSSGPSSFLMGFIAVVFAADNVLECGFLEDQGRGIVIVKLCLWASL